MSGKAGVKIGADRSVNAVSLCQLGSQEAQNTAKITTVSCIVHVEVRAEQLQELEHRAVGTSIAAVEADAQPSSGGLAGDGTHQCHDPGVEFAGQEGQSDVLATRVEELRADIVCSGVHQHSVKVQARHLRFRQVELATEKAAYTRRL